MMSNLDRIEQLLAGMLEAVAELRTMELADGEVSDAAGQVRRVEVDLATIRRAWNQQVIDNREIPAKRPVQVSQFDKDTAVDVGTKFQTKVTRSAKRTFRTASILAGTSKVSGADPMQELNMMVRYGAAKIDWKYTKLKEYLAAKGIDLAEHTAKNRPVDDDGSVDDEWMGEVWSATVTQQAIAQEEQDE